MQTLYLRSPARVRTFLLAGLMALVVLALLAPALALAQTTPPGTVPRPLSNLAIVGNSKSPGARPCGPGITAYEVQYRAVSTAEAVWVNADEINSVARTVTIDGLDDGTRYEVQVRAIISSDLVARWSDSGFGTPYTTPGEFTAVPVAGEPPAVTPRGVSSINVTWTAPDSGGTPITGYDVQYYKGTGAPGDAGDWKTWPHSGIARHTTEYHRLGEGCVLRRPHPRVKNRAGPGDWSEPSAGIMVEITKPSLPRDVTVAADYAKLMVSWETPTDDAGSQQWGSDHRLRCTPSAPRPRLGSGGCGGWHPAARRHRPQGHH